MKNDSRRQEAIASLFHDRDRDKVLDGQEVKERQDLGTMNDPRRQEAIASLVYFSSTDKVGD